MIGTIVRALRRLAAQYPERAATLLLAVGLVAAPARPLRAQESVQTTYSGPCPKGPRYSCPEIGVVRGDQLPVIRVRLRSRLDADRPSCDRDVDFRADSITAFANNVLAAVQRIRSAKVKIPRPAMLVISVHTTTGEFVQLDIADVLAQDPEMDFKTRTCGLLWGSGQSGLEFVQSLAETGSTLLAALKQAQRTLASPVVVLRERCASAVPFSCAEVSAVGTPDGNVVRIKVQSRQDPSRAACTVTAEFDPQTMLTFVQDIESKTESFDKARTKRGFTVSASTTRGSPVTLSLVLRSQQDGYFQFDAGGCRGHWEELEGFQTFLESLGKATAKIYSALPMP